MTNKQFADSLILIVDDPTRIQSLSKMDLNLIYGICKRIADLSDIELKKRARSSMKIVK